MKSLVKYGKTILKKLNDSGYEAYFVGGYVRDKFLNIESNDIDIATNALPSDVETLFENTVATGKKYGTVTVFIENHGFEITTYRIDQEYINYRQPEYVEFSSDLKDDLIRRDFTMNALAEDIHGDVIDMFDGKADIQQRIIRAIDDPYKRFNEDALRILRAIRFVGKLDFSIEDDTFNAMKKHVQLLDELPTERIIKEIELILKQNHIKNVYQLMSDIKLGHVFENLEPAIDKLKNTTLNVSIEQFFALGLYPDEKLDIIKWRFSKKQIRDIETIIELMDLLLKQRLTPIIIYNNPRKSLLEANELLTHFFDYENQEDKIVNLYRHLKINSFKDLEISGHEIAPLVKDPKSVGKIIEDLIEDVLNDKLENDKDTLLKRATEIAEELNEKD
ncbi:MAG: CCA tRNA nucleotidyltransferase [Candidatus Izemoplasmatales bacterium]